MRYRDSIYELKDYIELDQGFFKTTDRVQTEGWETEKKERQPRFWQRWKLFCVENKQAARKTSTRLKRKQTLEDDCCKQA